MTVVTFINAQKQHNDGITFYMIKNYLHIISVFTFAS